MSITLHRHPFGAGQVTLVRTSRSFRFMIGIDAQNDPRAHFGLGNASKVDKIEVLWPDGARELFPGGEAGKIMTLRRTEGAPP